MPRTSVRWAFDCPGGWLRLLAALGLVTLIVLLAAPRAEAVPSVTFECTPAPEDCSGWHRSNVSIDWTVLPSNATITGCQDKTYSADTPGTSEFCSARDGGVTSTVQLKIQVDQTPPVTTGGTPSRGADRSGWYAGPVGITFAGSDLTSGIESCTSTTYRGPDSGSVALSGTCRDNAGNVSLPFPYGLKYDETDPSVTHALPERAANAAGWFNRAIGFDVQGTDATSGIANCPSVTYSGPDSVSAGFTGTCTDGAGNSAARPFTLKYDGTAPAVTGAQPARGPNGNGWYRDDVSIAFSGTDQLSGIRSCTTPTYSGPDSGAASVSGTCTDEAGNVSNPSTFGLKFDSTDPFVIGGQPGRAADANGWYNHDVSVAFNGSDETSGVAACTPRPTAARTAPTASVPGTCTDRAGNTSSPLGFGLKYDETAPEVTGAQAERPPDQAPWYVEPVRFDFIGFDKTSGIADCPSVEYSGPDGPDAAVIGRCRDLADNTSQQAFPLHFDGNPPEVTDLKLVAGNRRLELSWQTTADVASVQVLRTPGIGADGSTVVFGGPGKGFVDDRVDNGVSYAYRVTVSDIAGNTGSRTVSGVPTAPAAPAVDSVAPSPPAPVTLPRARRLITPLPGAIVPLGHPPLLQWTPVRKAQYYNVQLFRAGRKHLTAWPRAPRYHLKSRWTYAGKPRRLTPGHYRWIVWPGYGPRSKADYGKAIGRSTFVVKR